MACGPKDIADNPPPPLLGHTPSTAGTFRKKFRKNSGKTPETLSERFLEFPSRVRLGCPKPYNSRHLRLPERFQHSLPPQYSWGRLFFQNWFRRGPLRAGHGIPSSTGVFLIYNIYTVFVGGGGGLHFEEVILREAKPGGL